MIKKIVSTFLLASFVCNLAILTPQKASALGLYDDVFDSGDIYFPAAFTVTAGPTYNNKGIDFIDSGAGYTVTNEISTVVSGMPVHTLVSPYGQLLVIHAIFGVSFNITCIINFNDNYGVNGSGSDSDYCNGFDADGPVMDAATMIDPDDGSTNPATALYGSGFHKAVVAQNGDVWMAYTGRSYIVRVLYEPGCENETYTTEVACTGNGSSWGNWHKTEFYDMTYGGEENYSYAGLAVNLFGDVWIGNGYGAGGEAHCLDASNDFQKCVDSNLDSHGGINFNDQYVRDVVVDEHGNLYFVTDSQIIYKMGSTDINQAVTLDYSSQSTVPMYLTYDYSSGADDRLWVAGYDFSTSTINEFFCVDATTMTLDGPACGNSILAYSLSSQPNGNVNHVFIDKFRNYWISDINLDKLYCYTSSFVACSGGSFVAGALQLTNIWQRTSFGDPTGYHINFLMDNSAGQGQVDIAATVDPTISLTLSSNTCNLGNLTTATANTCTYDVTTATNAANGLVVKFSADTAYLASGSNNIDACASSGCTGGVNAGTEEYGFYVSTVGSNHDATGYSADSEPLPTTATTVITAADPHTDTTSTITHKAAVSPITPAGAYFHTVTVTAVGSF